MNDPAQLEAQVIGFVLILARVATCLAMMPFFSGKEMPRTVKIGLALSLSFLWFGTTAPTDAVAVASVDGRWFALALAVAKEIMLGAMLGYWFGLLLLPARLAGSYIGQEMGLTLATVTSPGTQESTNVMGSVFESFAAFMFFAMDMHHVMLGMIQASFEKWPAGATLSASQFFALSEGVAEAHQWGLQIAAPVAICLFLNLASLALLIKASPQLNLFSVGLTLRIVIGLIATLAFLPEMLHLTAGVFGQAENFIKMGG